MNKIDRSIEVRKLKMEIKEMLSEMGVSRALFLKNLPKMTRTKKQKNSNNSGYLYKISLLGDGKKASLRQRWSYLKDLMEMKKREELRDLLKETKVETKNEGE